MNNKKAKENHITALSDRWRLSRLESYLGAGKAAPYDESKYLEALKQKGSPLLKFAINS